MCGMATFAKRSAVGAFTSVGCDDFGAEQRRQQERLLASHLYSQSAHGALTELLMKNNLLSIAALSLFACLASSAGLSAADTTTPEKRLSRIR
jgi:hypothetical protein